MAEKAGRTVPASLREIVAHGQPFRAGERLLPVVPPIADLLPEPGLRRGTTVAVSGSTSLLLTMLAAPSRDGAWCAVVGLASLGVVAAAEAGLALDRFVLVPDPGPRWPVVVAALLDAMDVVAVRPPAPAGVASRRLAARARHRGTLLIPVGEWEGADLRLSIEDSQWDGLGQGHGRLRARRALVRVQGRGAAARPRSAWLEETWPDTVGQPLRPSLPAVAVA
jgi:hypothetical protein